MTGRRPDASRKKPNAPEDAAFFLSRPEEKNKPKKNQKTESRETEPPLQVRSAVNAKFEETVKITFYTTYLNNKYLFLEEYGKLKEWPKTSEVRSVSTWHAMEMVTNSYRSGQ